MTQAFMDASSAILLHKADLFFPCCRNFSLVMAGAVFEEITRPGYPGARAFEEASEQRQFRVREPDPVIDKSYSGLERLDPGEKETIALYLQYAGTRAQGFVILDDFKGARFCRSNDIPYMNALLVPKVFWYSGVMTQDDCQTATATLLNLGRYSKQIAAKALELTRSDLARFEPGFRGEDRP